MIVSSINDKKNPSPSHWRDHFHVQADNDGRVSQNADNPMNHVGLDLDNLELTILDFLNIPSPHITPYHMLDIYKKNQGNSWSI